MNEAAVRPPEAVCTALGRAAELLLGERLVTVAVLRLLRDAVDVAEPDHHLIGQLELAIADVGHWRVRCGQIEQRLRELAGVETPGTKQEQTWANGQPLSRSGSPLR